MTDSKDIGNRRWVTVKDVAEQVGVARSTAGHILTGRGRELGISEETRARVFEMARQLGYRPNASARAMKKGCFDTIGFLATRFQEYLPVPLLRGIMEEAARHGKKLLMTEVERGNLGEPGTVPKLLRELSLDGVLTSFTYHQPKAATDYMRELRIPSVAINYKKDANAVYPDEFNGARAITDRLLERGCRRIAYFDITTPGTVTHYSTIDRQAGYRAALEQAGIEPRIEAREVAWEFRKGGENDPRLEPARNLLAGDNPPEAVICSESAAVGPLLRAAIERGWQIPRDIMILAFHHEPLTSLGWPVHFLKIPHEQCGRKAVEMLLNQIENGDESTPAIVVPYNFKEAGI